MRLWMWRGAWFGYREGQALWTHDGRHVGKFVDDAVYSPTGRYLGEVRAGRLLTRRANRTRRGAPFARAAPRETTRAHVELVALTLPPGYDDFPCAEALR